MVLEIRGFPRDQALRAHVAAQLAAITRPLRVKPVAAEVGFVDENGPKGGIAIRCSVTVRLPRRPALHVEHLAETPRLAFDQTMARLERRLLEDRGRERERRRRPKKYYTAKRLLEPSAEGASAKPGPPRRRRAS
ncbi:MAG TPA: HPF/RaiA family ribosome-associated protein [Methylomirabilota bacterium]|jgi:ribosome-associated translation inhibitor RaiA|nr:HPF/RaiA family ribosome-associated protein [Methylomirabilota bacterium]